MRHFDKTNVGNCCRHCGAPYECDVPAGHGKFWVASAMAALIGGCLCLVAMTGCSIKTKNQGEAGIRYGTEITFFSRAAQTAPEPAEIKTDVPSLEHWLFDPKLPPAGTILSAWKMMSPEERSALLPILLQTQTTP